MKDVPGGQSAEPNLAVFHGICRPLFSFKGLQDFYLLVGRKIPRASVSDCAKPAKVSNVEMKSSCLSKIATIWTPGREAFAFETHRLD
jgi:hypothetical protein